MGTLMEARAIRAKSGWVNFSRRLSRRTATNKYRPEKKGRRSFDPAIEYGTVAIIATEKTWTPQCGTVHATCLPAALGLEPAPARKGCGVPKFVLDRADDIIDAPPAIVAV